MSEEDDFGIEALLDDEVSNKEMPEFMGESGLQVTGQSRLEAAYGSGDGDEDGMAVVAKTGQVEVGTYFHQTYRTWRGELNSRWVRNWSIHQGPSKLAHLHKITDDCGLNRLTIADFDHVSWHDVRF